MIALYALAAASTLQFDCTVQPPRNVIVTGEDVSSRKIGLPAEPNKWAFALRLENGADETSVALNWPGDPIRAGQALAAIPIGPHDYSFVSIHGGPCLFTVSACMFMYTLSEQADGSADILIQPAALATEGERSKPFQVFMRGRCIRKSKSR